MEDYKINSLASAARQAKPRSLMKWVIGISAVIAAGALLHNADRSPLSWTQAGHGPFAGPNIVLQVDDGREFDWEALSPSRDLEYVSCYGKFECARLLLPMDWTAPEEHQRDHEVAIAMIKQPANISVLDPRYGGEVFLNPGGPGAPGVAMMMGRHHNHLNNAINGNDTDGKVYDIVSFDPRGVGFSTPRISCFNDLVSRQLWHQLGTAYGTIYSSDRSFDMIWARARSLSKLCDSHNLSSETSLFLSTVATAFVARDILAMVEKGGETREKRAREVAEKGRTKDRSLELPESVRYQPGKELLNYWGFSYGGFLGGTFASLYPDRVGRMIFDGCGDWADSASGEFKGFLVDTDREWKEFFNLCHAAGPKRCALFEDKGPDVMEASIQTLLDTLESNPIPVAGEELPFPDIFTKDTLIQGIFSSLYSPYRNGTWIKLADTLSALLNGTITPGALDMLPSRRFRVSNSGCKTDDCAIEGMGEGFWDEINYGIYCTDSPDFRNLTKSDMVAWAAGLREQSPLFGGMFATTSKIPCVGYPTRPKWRFSGPFGGKTKTPVLFIGNTLDPVAPLVGTRMNVPLFEGARLLQQDSVGHCSTGAPSKCTVSHVRRYFALGVLPDEGTVCGVDNLPFDQDSSLRF